MINEFKPLERFSDRVENYIKYRPAYPKEVINFLKNNIALNSEHIIADIGSGTGISSINFLENKNKVIGIEPNDNMRSASEKLLMVYPNFTAVKASAENTTLPDKSIDIILAGQAFHWFDVENAKKEFKRILKDDGCVVLIWNEKDFSKELMAEYEHILLKYGTDYAEVKHNNIDTHILKSFFDKGYHETDFNNEQIFDFAGLKGRLLSSSYIPVDNSQMIDDLKVLFDKFQLEQNVKFEYKTKVYFGQL